MINKKEKLLIFLFAFHLLTAYSNKVYNTRNVVQIWKHGGNSVEFQSWCRLNLVRLRWL